MFSAANKPEPAPKNPRYTTHFGIVLEYSPATPKPVSTIAHATISAVKALS